MSGNPGPSDLGFVHRYEPATDARRPPLLLLHGTGGSEDDLIPLGRQLSPGAALLSPRGKVSENGMARYFRRLAEGVFDIDDLKHRAGELAGFVTAARNAYKIAPPIAVGFSNGANIAWMVLLRHPGVLGGAVLIRAAMPFQPDPASGLDGTPVLILSGDKDPVSTAAGSAALAKLLEEAGAEVTHSILPAEHALTPKDIEIATAWLARR